MGGRARLGTGSKWTQDICSSPRLFLYVGMVEALKTLMFQEGLNYAAHFPVIQTALPLRRIGEDCHLHVASLPFGSLHYHPPREAHWTPAHVLPLGCSPLASPWPPLQYSSSSPRPDPSLNPSWEETGSHCSSLTRWETLSQTPTIPRHGPSANKHKERDSNFFVPWSRTTKLSSFPDILTRAKAWEGLCEVSSLHLSPHLTACGRAVALQHKLTFQSNWISGFLVLLLCSPSGSVGYSAQEMLSWLGTWGFGGC